MFSWFEYLYIGAFVAFLLYCILLYKKSMEHFSLARHQLELDGHQQKLGSFKAKSAIQSSIKTKEGFGAMGPLLPELSSIGSSSIDLNETQQKRYEELEKGCQHKREKCYIVGSVESCNYQYKGCIQDSLWDAKMNTPKEYISPEPKE